MGLGDVTQVRPSPPGPARVGVTTHERLRLMGMTFCWVRCGRWSRWWRGCSGGKPQPACGG